MAQQEFIPYEQALELFELGFDEECLGYYHTTLSSSDVDLIIGKTPDRFYHLIRIPEHFDTLAPLYQQAFRWFREKKIFGAVVPIDDWDYWGITIFEQDCMAPFYVSYMSDMDYKEYPTYEEAELECLKKLIEIVKNK